MIRLARPSASRIAHGNGLVSIALTTAVVAGACSGRVAADGEQGSSLEVSRATTAIQSTDPMPVPTETAEPVEASPERSPGGFGQPGEAGTIVSPKLVRTESVETLGPVAVRSFPSASLLSVSPDGRYALVWTGTAEKIRRREFDLLAVPLDGGDPIELGTAGYEPRIPDYGLMALPAWSTDSRSVAFENGRRGTIASLVGEPAIAFDADADAPLSPLAGGGFVVNTADGPQVVGAVNPQPLAATPGLTDVVYFPDGRAAVGTNSSGALLWTDGIERRVIDAWPDFATSSRWWPASRTDERVVLFGEDHARFAAFGVRRNGEVTPLDLADAGPPNLTADGRYAAFPYHDRLIATGGPEAYWLRVTRLPDGASIHIGPGAYAPMFLPGTNRLAWMGLVADAADRVRYTLFVATNEVLP